MRSALLLSLAVVCATVAVVPQTAGATASKNPNITAATYLAPLNLTAQDACPMSSAPAAGFSDTTSTDVDCIKMFGITQGTTATTYEPDASIPRWQMALFIHRMFVPTGMAAAGLTAVPAFTDTSGLSSEIQDAISALASHKITLGCTTTTFCPNDNVTRSEMALFLFRVAQIVGDYDEATPNGLTMDLVDYNYTDIANESFEAMEAVIGLYNLGVTGETCTTVTDGLGACSTSYRPSEDITRAEMASMIKELLDHTNARPAGVSIQSVAAAAAGSVSSTISLRNADFTPIVNGYVDEFYQVRDDTSAATAALSTPFNALSGLCTDTGAGAVSTAQGTLCLMTTGDKVTNAKGNVAGAAQTMAAATTGRWWVWTGDQGAIYVDGTTSTVFNYDTSLSATATGSVYAATAKPTFGVHNAEAANFSAGVGNPVTGNDGIHTYAGGSRTITVNLGASPTNIALGLTPIEGYTVKFTDAKTDYLGNRIISNTYVASADNKATYTVTCGADNSATTNGLMGASGALDYWEAHEVTVAFGTAAAGTGLPDTVGAAPTLSYPDTIGDNNDTMNVSCDDEVRAYDATNGGGSVETLTVGDNTVAVSATGTLASITASAYDQYGTGKSGVTVQFKSQTQENIGNLGALTNRGLLTTGADGTATLTAVVCTTNSQIQWSVNTDNGVMDTIADAEAGLTEGTNIYCASAGVDGAYVDTAKGDQVSVITIDDVTADIDTGEIQICLQNEGGLGGATGDAVAQCATSGHAKLIVAGVGGAASVEEDLEALTNTPAAMNVVETATGGGSDHIITITFPVNTGLWTITIPSNTLGAGELSTTAAPITHTTAGVTEYTLDFIDDNPATGELLTLKTSKVSDGDGAAGIKKTYETWTVDDTDVFETAATKAATRTQFNTANALISNLTTNVTLSYRSGALTTGVSYVKVG